MEDEKLEFKFATGRACEHCKYNGTFAADYHCCKYRIKPRKVLYDEADCEKFKKE